MVPHPFPLVLRELLRSALHSGAARTNARMIQSPWLSTPPSSRLGHRSPICTGRRSPPIRRAALVLLTRTPALEHGKPETSLPVAIKLESVGVHAIGLGALLILINRVEHPHEREVRCFAPLSRPTLSAVVLSTSFWPCALSWGRTLPGEFWLWAGARSSARGVTLEAPVALLATIETLVPIASESLSSRTFASSLSPKRK